MHKASLQGPETFTSRSPRFRWPVVLMARVALGVIFLWASIDKVLHPAAFAEIIYAYQILPDSWISLTAIVLPWIELILGSLLILGFWLPGAVVLSNLLLATFLAALVFNMARGLDVDCGCFSTGGKSGGSMWSYLVRDLSFLVVSGLLLVRIIFPGDRRRMEASQSPPVCPRALSN